MACTRPAPRPQFDANRSGDIDVSELADALAVMAATSGSAPANTEGSGVVTGAGPRRDYARARSVMKRYDADGNGFLDMEEVCGQDSVGARRGPARTRAASASEREREQARPTHSCPVAGALVCRRGPRSRPPPTTTPFAPTCAFYSSASLCKTS